MAYKTYHKEKQKNKNRKLANLHGHNVLKKNTMSQRHRNYYGFVKSRVGSRMSSGRKQENKKSLFNRKDGPKGAFLNKLKIENGTKNQLVVQIWHWDPLKTVPGIGLGKS